MSAADRVDTSNLISRSDDNITPSDIVRIFLGYYDKDTGKFVNGYMRITDENSKALAFEHRVQRYLIYFIAVVSAFRFFGVNQAGDLLKLFTGHGI